MKNRSTLDRKDKNKTEKAFNIKWSTKPIKILGRHIGHNKEEAYRANCVNS